MAAKKKAGKEKEVSKGEETIAEQFGEKVSVEPAVEKTTPPIVHDSVSAPVMQTEGQELTAESGTESDEQGGTAETPTSEVEPPEGEKTKVSSDEAKKWLEGVSSELETEDSDDKGINFKLIALIFMILGLIGIVVGGIFYYKSRVSKPKEGEGLPTPTAQPVTIIPTETPKEEKKEETRLDLSKYSLRILNGSGMPGEAGKVADMLDDLDFNQIKTANADSYDYEKTEVSLKKDTPKAVYDEIKKKIEEVYDVELTESTLAASTSFDAEITVGKKK